MAWVAHQLVSDPLQLFDANIFYPERHTLAYSDHLFVQSLMGAPLTWAGFSPVLVHNVVLIAGYALTGWTTALVVARWSGSRAAGLLSGSLVAFNAFTLTRLPQIQDLHLEFFPLVLLALDRLLVYGQVRDALAVAGWFVLQSLTGHVPDGLYRNLHRRGDAREAARLAGCPIRSGGAQGRARGNGRGRCADALPAALSRRQPRSWPQPVARRDSDATQPS